MARINTKTINKSESDLPQSVAAGTPIRNNGTNTKLPPGGHVGNDSASISPGQSNCRKVVNDGETLNSAIEADSTNEKKKVDRKPGEHKPLSPSANRQGNSQTIDRIIGCSIWMRTLSPLCIWQDIHYRKRPPPTRNDHTQEYFIRTS